MVSAEVLEGGGVGTAPCLGCRVEVASSGLDIVDASSMWTRRFRVQLR